MNEGGLTRNDEQGTMNQRNSKDQQGIARNNKKQQGTARQNEERGTMKDERGMMNED